MSVKIIDNKYIIYISEYPNIKINYLGNERLKNEELNQLAEEIKLKI